MSVSILFRFTVDPPSLPAIGGTAGKAVYGLLTVIYLFLSIVGPGKKKVYYM